MGSETNPNDIPGIAPNEAFYRAAGSSGPACGECYEVTSNVGTQIFRVVSACPANGNDVCQGDMVHFDIRSATSFGLVGETKAGILWMSHKKVACPVSGNVRIHVRDSNSGYLSLIVLNNKYRVDKVEIQNGGNFATFTKNGDTAQFDYQGSYSIPATLRLTSEFNEQISFSLTSSTVGAIITGTSNFNTATTVQDEACYYPIPPVIFDDDFNANQQQFMTGSNWNVTSMFSCKMNQRYTPAKVGSYALAMELTNYGGFGFSVWSFVPKEYIESIRFWAKASQATDDIKMDLDFPPTKVISLTTEWQQITVPLSELSNVPDQINRITFQSSLSTTVTVYMDQIEIVLPENIVLPPMATNSPSGGSNPNPSSNTPATSGTPSNGPTGIQSPRASLVAWIGSVAVVASLVI
jgi:hypothetical protein